MEKFLPKKADKEVTTIRIPRDVLEKVDIKSADYGISRNEFINQCILYALRNMIPNCIFSQPERFLISRLVSYDLV